MASPFKPDVLKGKVALVSGGGTGINFGIVRTLGLHGCKVVITGRRKEVLDKSVAKLTSEGITAVGIQGDVRNFADCKKAVDAVVSQFGRLVNGAAGNFLCAAEELSPNGFKTVLEIDTMGTFHMCRAAFEALKANKQAVIINITATLHYTATQYQIHASAAKAGVDAMTRNLALEWGKHGIRVVGIAPGPIADTEGMTRLSGGGDQEQLDIMSKAIPIRRLGQTVDIANMALFLASSGATFITGQTIAVDGGETIYKPPFVTDETYAFISAQRKSKL